LGLRELPQVKDGVALGFWVAAFLAAAVISFGLLLCLKPLLARYALARPNARSSHKTPTSQGGGIAVIAATIVVVIATEIFLPRQVHEPLRLGVIFALAAGIALVGAADDIRPMEAIPRLLLQTAAVAAVVATLPYDMRVVPAFPWWCERAVLLVGGVWLVNVVNFMDGIDWMTVAEIVPVTAGLALFGLVGALPHDATLVALALCGAVIGFAPFNRPVAQLFLGDVGSLPIGLLLGWLLVLLAGRGYFAAAVLLPLYYLADATITLLRRLVNGEPVIQPHRSHFYQRALDGGLSVYQIIGRVFALNIALGTLAWLTVVNRSPTLDAILIAAGGVLVAAVLWKFNSAGSRTQKVV
jgi:UDP-N-acetylmuramyl pentapeptide phosphotransferase/UDP-N-acetylglucosamine-1-phosphate transferase